MGQSSTARVEQSVGCPQNGDSFLVVLGTKFTALHCPVQFVGTPLSSDVPRKISHNGHCLRHHVATSVFDATMDLSRGIEFRSGHCRIGKTRLQTRNENDVDTSQHNPSRWV